LTELKRRYLPEAAHPYYVLKRNGFEIVFASPKGTYAAEFLVDSLGGEAPLDPKSVEM
jgi:putative intracellular protease/amidase